MNEIVVKNVQPSVARTSEIVRDACTYKTYMQNMLKELYLKAKSLLIQKKKYMRIACHSDN